MASAGSTLSAMRMATMLARTQITSTAKKPAMESNGISSTYLGNRGAEKVAVILPTTRSEEHTSELQSQSNIVCRLLLEKKNNSALPSIERDLKASFTDLQWVIDAYALSLAALVLSAGSLADLVGRRRVFAGGLAIFIVA